MQAIRILASVIGVALLIGTSISVLKTLVMPGGRIGRLYHTVGRAVDRLFAGSGGHALFDASPLQRFHRDIHAASHHVSLSWDTASEQYGRVLLGLEPTNRRF